MKHLLAVPIILAGIQGWALADTILPGTRIEVRSDNPIEVTRWDRGRIYPAHVARDVMARDGDVAIPRGSYAELIVRQNGPDQMTVDIESITVNGRRYTMDNTGPQFNMSQSDYTGGGGLVGGIVGAIAGATGAQVETRGGQIRVPAGAVLTFELRQPLHVVNWSDPGYDNNGYHYHRDHDWYR